MIERPVPEADAKDKAQQMPSEERRPLIERYRRQLETGMVAASLQAYRQQGFLKTMFAGEGARFFAAAGLAAFAAFRMYAD